MAFFEQNIFSSQGQTRFAYWEEWTLSFWEGYPGKKPTQYIGHIKFKARFGGEPGTDMKNNYIRVMRSWVEKRELPDNLRHSQYVENKGK